MIPYTRITAAFALAAASMIICVAQANAADLQLRSCTNDPNAGFTASNDLWLGAPIQPSTAGAAIGTCPSGMTFNTSIAANQGTSGSWRLKFDAIKSVSHLKLSYEGGDPSGGWQYTVNDCPSSCTPLAPPLTPTLPGEQSATLDIDIPSLTVLKVIAKCVVAVCSPATPLNFHDVVVTVHDVKAPVALVTLNSSYWQRSSAQKASVTVYDTGGIGLSTTNASIDGNGSLLGRGACDVGFLYGGLQHLPPANYCDQSLSIPFQTLDLTGVPDGVHYIVIDAVDAVGNVMKTSKTRFEIDDTPPNTPEDPVLTGVNEFGWTQLDAIGIKWTNTSEAQESNLQSGVSLPRYRREPYPGFSGAPATVEGVFDTDTADSIKHVSLPTDAKWNVYVSTKDRAGNESGALKVTVGRDRGVPAQPVLAATNWMNQDALNKFRQPLSQPRGGEISGICGYATVVDSEVHTDPPDKISELGALQNLTVDRDLPDGVNRLHVRAISCAEVASTTAETDIKVDRAAPNLFVDGVPSSAWTNKPVAAAFSATDELSGVASVTYGIDGAAPQTAAADSAQIDAPRGDHTLRFAATDHAGNTAPAMTREIRFDDAAPEVTIDAFDPDRPTQLSGIVRDKLSGAANAVFEYRRADADGPWTQLPTATQADAVGAPSMTVGATIPDADFDAGTYDFRLRASDVAGNASLTTETTQRTFPLREQPKLSALLATVGNCKSQRSCTSRTRIDYAGAKHSRTIGYGSAIALTGELGDQHGNPLANEKLKIYSAVGGNNPELVGEPVTDARGKFEFLPGRGPSRRFTVRYAGSSHFLPVSDSADLGVSVGAKLRVSPRTVHNGGSIRLSGQVLGGSGRYSAEGLHVVIKYFRPGNGWKPAVDNPVVDANGGFIALPYKFTGLLNAAKTVKFKALIITGKTGFPFVEGYSNVATVRLLP